MAVIDVCCIVGVFLHLVNTKMGSVSGQSRYDFRQIWYVMCWVNNFCGEVCNTQPHATDGVLAVWFGNE